MTMVLCSNLNGLESVLPGIGSWVSRQNLVFPKYKFPIVIIQFLLDNKDR